MSAVWVDARALRRGVLTPPPSKSDALRALVLAHALDWPELARSLRATAELPDDVRTTVDGLAALAGAGRTAALVQCGDGGAPFRFLLSQAAVRRGLKTRFVGSPRLGARPHAALFAALHQTLGPWGLSLVPGTPWPVDVTGAASPGRPVFRVGGAESSQFASSLALAAAGLAHREGRTWTIELEGPTASAGYLALTLEWLQRCGVEVKSARTHFTVGPHHRPARVPAVPGDWSSAGYLALVAWKSGSRLHGLDPAAHHPDACVVRHLASVGITLDAASGTVVGQALHGLRASAAEAPDLIPTLAALACVLPQPSVFTALEVLKAKESDRLAGVMALVQAAGARAELEGDALTIFPVTSRPQSFEVRSQGDHRLAMAGATLATLLGARAHVHDAGCVSKSFPGFWRELDEVGIHAEG